MLTFGSFFVNEMVWIWKNIWLKVVPKDVIFDKSALIQELDLRHLGAELFLASMLTKTLCCLEETGDVNELMLMFYMIIFTGADPAIW